MTSAQGGRAGGADLRRLVLVVGAVVFLETLFYSVIAPLLPELTHNLHLSKSSAGLMSGAYAAGTMVASIPGGILATRLGPRFTVCLGVSLLSIATLGFGWASTVAMLDIARLLEGVGGALAWVGGLAWIVVEAPPQRRGEMIGKALGAAVAGALFGPALGALASATGRPGVFTFVALISAGLVLVTGRVPHSAMPSRQGLDVVWRALKQPIFLVTIWVMAVPAVFSGAVNLLAPLRLHQFGASSLVIGVIYVVCAAGETVISPMIGKLSDRRGRLVPVRGSLLGSTVILVLFAIPHDVVLVALLLLASIFMLGSAWGPLMALFSDVAESENVDQALGAALMNLGWAGGQLIGTAFGGVAAKQWGDGITMEIVAVLCAATFIFLAWRRVSVPIENVHAAQAPKAAPADAAPA